MYNGECTWENVLNRNLEESLLESVCLGMYNEEGMAVTVY